MKEQQQDAQLKRGLENRHMQLIALGGTIGVGLFYGSSSTIQLAGPAVLLAYLIGGLMIFTIMRALGEMTVAEPVSGSFSNYANKYLGKFAGFLTGWTYWFMWVVIGMTELTVVGVYINYWFPDVPQWVTALVVLVMMTLINIANVKMYGEFEFWFAMIKIVAIIGMIIIGLCIILFGLGHHGEPTGISNLWEHGGFFPNGMKGFLMCFSLVMFSFGGVELVGVTAGEAKNPMKSVPKAINNILLRIIIFYIGALGVMMAIYPWDEVGSKGSPFVQIFDAFGIPASAHIINFVVITAAVSSLNSGLYGSARMLHNLAIHNQAPKVFKNVSKSGVPLRGILFSSSILLIAVVLNYVIPEQVFTYISSVATIAMVTSWTIILLAQIKFRKAKSKEEVAALKFKMPFYPITSYIALVFLFVVVVLMAFIPDTRGALYVAPVWFLILGIGYKAMKV